MKTLTEFSGLTIQRAAAARAQFLADGVAADALSEAMGTALTLSGDRLSRLLEALEAVADAAAKVRLVRVFAGEAAPAGAKKVGEFHYVIDWQAAPAKTVDQRHARGKGGRDKDRGRGGSGGPRRGDAKSAQPSDGEERGSGPMPTRGAGWTLSRAVVPPEERRGGKGRPGGKGPRRDGRKPNRPGAPVAAAPGTPPTGDRPQRPGGGGRPAGDRRPPRAPGAPGAPNQRPAHSGRPGERPAYAGRGPGERPHGDANARPAGGPDQRPRGPRPNQNRRPPGPPRPAGTAPSAARPPQAPQTQPAPTTPVPPKP